MKNSHNHLSGELLLLQVDYCRSSVAFETARNIINMKIHSSRKILEPYLRSRLRSGSVFAKDLLQICNKLKNLENAPHMKNLFHIEAQAAKYYWHAIALICNPKSKWKRVYPHAEDSLNILLNIGYTFLARHCLDAIIKTKLVPEIGVLHKENSKDPLVYDLMECFRHIAVDSVVLASFARRPKNGIEKDSVDFKKVLAKLTRQYDRNFSFNTRQEKLKRIIWFETVRLKNAISDKTPWIPSKIKKDRASFAVF